MSNLTFDQLRAANTRRIAQFKNSKGEPAHSTADGSDWSPAQWIQAWVGEVGELCQVRCNYEMGHIHRHDFLRDIAKELPDSLIYQDLAATRMLDEVAEGPPDHAQTLMFAIACIGAYANARKKFDRGDIDQAALDTVKALELNHALSLLEDLRDDRIRHGASNKVIEAHSTGLDLGQTVIDKFNEVSVRVGADVRL